MDPNSLSAKGHALPSRGSCGRRFFQQLSRCVGCIVLYLWRWRQYDLVSFLPTAPFELSLTYPSDATYPDTASGGYKNKDCGRYAPAAVISTSYGSNEADLTPAYEQRQCNEYVLL